MPVAIAFSEYGAPTVLHPIDIAEPEPGAGEVRVRIRAAGVAPFDAKLRAGELREFFPAAFPQRLGNEFAGVVDAVGEGVTGFAAGDEVLGWALLVAYAEVIVVPATQLAVKPADLSWEIAGALSVVGQGAYGFVEELGVAAGETFLIHACAGGVGTVAAQLAVLRGAKVIGTAGEANHDYLRSLGVTPVTYGPAWPTGSGRPRPTGWTRRSTRSAARPPTSRSSWSRIAGGSARSSTPRRPSRNMGSGGCRAPAPWRPSLTWPAWPRARS